MISHPQTTKQDTHHLSLYSTGKSSLLLFEREGERVSWWESAVWRVQHTHPPPAPPPPRKKTVESVENEGTTPLHSAASSLDNLTSKKIRLSLPVPRYPKKQTTKDTHLPVHLPYLSVCIRGYSRSRNSDEKARHASWHKKTRMHACTCMHAHAYYACVHSCTTASLCSK